MVLVTIARVFSLSGCRVAVSCSLPSFVVHLLCSLRVSADYASIAAHSRLMVEEAQRQRIRAERAEKRTIDKLSHARQQLVVAQQFAKQVESRTQAVETKLKRSEMRRSLVESQLISARSLAAAATYRAEEGSKVTSLQVKSAVDQMSLLRLEHQLAHVAARMEAQSSELTELRTIQREWRATHEFASDGRLLGADVPDFEDTADRYDKPFDVGGSAEHQAAAEKLTSKFGRQQSLGGSLQATSSVGGCNATTEGQEEDAVMLSARSRAKTQARPASARPALGGSSRHASMSTTMNSSFNLPAEDNDEQHPSSLERPASASVESRRVSIVSN